MSAATLSLYDIESQLLQLLEFRESAETPEEKAAADKEIEKYIQLEIRKVDGIAKFIRNEEAAAEVISKEVSRLRARVDRHITRVQWMKNLALEAMHLINEKKLEGDTNTLRRQDNPEALVITSPDLIPSQMCQFTATMTHQQYRELLIALNSSEVGLTLKPFFEQCVKRTPINADVKTALKNGAHVPGARLERGESLRIL